MPEFTSYIQGTPSCAELTTSDYQGALTFYSVLFGWEDEANEMSPGTYYHMQKFEGLEVTTLYKQGDEEKQLGVPSYWKIYFTVDDVQKSSKQAKESGAFVIFGLMEVFDAGHAAILHILFWVLVSGLSRATSQPTNSRKNFNSKGNGKA